ncbi:MAG TPA: chloride channel protein, partial [Anseongella sp.]|nr:chloride channel protein [Anseongella sp.]
RVTANERKILLAAGATAGMAAIFGSPFAAILLAVELLLFEFSPRSIIPVALACITGAACHIAFFAPGPMLEMPAVAAPTYTALANYSVIGALIGIMSALITRIVYLIEDGFEKLPVHWMWWPAIGSIAVGVTGFFAPATLGVGYENISTAISGEASLQVLLVLFGLKFISWAVSLGSGTSGGTLAPLLTIGGAAGALIGTGWLAFFPESGINIPTAALVGMAAMFAGASRALLTSIVFALESTMQPNTLTPLLGGCTAAYFVSFFLMENTIMTEKIARRGVHTPHSYAPDTLDGITVKQLMREGVNLLSADNTIGEARSWLEAEQGAGREPAFVVMDKDQHLVGTVELAQIMSAQNAASAPITDILHPRNLSIYEDNVLRVAVDIMAKMKLGVLPVVSREEKNRITGIISYQDILQALRLQSEELEKMKRTISIKRRSFQVIVRGRQLFNRS